MYAELQASRTRRTVTDTARLLRALRLDGMLLAGIGAVGLFGLFVLYSAAGDNVALWFSQLARFGIGVAVLIALARVPDHFLRLVSPALYAFGLLLLVAVELVGDVGKGAQRWLDLGLFRFQPSEIMKLAVPMMCAWYLHQRPLPPGLRDILVVLAILLVPVFLVAAQPDLGTAVLIVAAGLVVLVMAGLSVYWLLGGIAVAGAAAPGLWHFLHDYQRQRGVARREPERETAGGGHTNNQTLNAIGHENGRGAGKGRR